MCLGRLIRKLPYIGQVAAECPARCVIKSHQFLTTQTQPSKFTFKASPAFTAYGDTPPGDCESRQPQGRRNAQRLRALVFLLRYIGLRIGDAVNCLVDRLNEGKLRLYTAKTGTHVHCPLPDFVVREPEATPRRSDGRWFWTGNGKLETAVGGLAGAPSGIVQNRKD